MGYSPILGRFLQRDPVEDAGVNLYEYVLSDPIALLDPMGYQATTQPSPPTTGPTTQPVLIDPNWPPPDANKQQREAFAKALEAELAAWQRSQPDDCCAKIMLDPCTLAAQWMYESGWGRSTFTQQTKNLGNIKGQGPAGSVGKPVREHIGGKDVIVQSPFRKYNDFPEFFQDYTNLICTNKRYEKARGQIGKEFYQALSDGGYATDPNYVKIATQIYNQLGCS